MDIKVLLISDSVIGSAAHLFDRKNDIYAKLADAMGEGVEVYRYTYERTCRYGPTWYAPANPLPFGSVEISRLKLWESTGKNDTSLKINFWNGDAWQQYVSSQPHDDIFDPDDVNDFSILAEEIQKTFEEWKIRQAEVLHQRLATLESE